jgi:hypothetical protein
MVKPRQCLLKERPLKGTANLEDPVRFEGRQIDADDSPKLGQSLVANFVLDSTAMVVQGDCVYPG